MKRWHYFVLINRLLYSRLHQWTFICNLQQVLARGALLWFSEGFQGGFHLYRCGQESAKKLPPNLYTVVPSFPKTFVSKYNQLNYYFNFNNLLTNIAKTIYNIVFVNNQYGLRRGRFSIRGHRLSTIEGFKEKESVVFCYDWILAKAFDCAMFDILLQKLSFFGISDQSLRVIGSYLWWIGSNLL